MDLSRHHLLSRGRFLAGTALLAALGAVTALPARASGFTVEKTSDGAIILDPSGNNVYQTHVNYGGTNTSVFPGGSFSFPYAATDEIVYNFGNGLSAKYEGSGQLVVSNGAVINAQQARTTMQLPGQQPVTLLQPTWHAIQQKGCQKQPCPQIQVFPCIEAYLQAIACGFLAGPLGASVVVPGVDIGTIGALAVDISGFINALQNIHDDCFFS